MPRRPRPAHRGSQVAHEEKTSLSEEFKERSREEGRPVVRKVLKRRREEEDEEVDAEADVDVEADTPRFVQWLDDEDEPAPARSWEDESKPKVPDDESLEPSTYSNSDLEDERTVEEVKGKGKEKVEWSIKPRKDIIKRSNKNAPIEVTSKRPVTRRRTVVEVPTIVPRDPRFLATAGEFSAEKFSKSYGFLVDKHKTELATLRETLKQARKLLASSPRNLRSEREDEVYRLEQAIKRAESMVNKDRLDQVQRDALGKAKKEEELKRQQGKGKWFLKKADQQQLVMKARYEALAKEGGARAVKKAILKKQKKVSQREKRSRPYKKQKSL
jgi:ribosomal RNA-processing protein 36